MRTLRLGALAQLLGLALQGQIRAVARVELLGNFRLDCQLCFALRHTVIVALSPALDSHDHARTALRRFAGGAGRRCCGMTPTSRFNDSQLCTPGIARRTSSRMQ
jgi:hypothetical protein